MLLPLTQNPCGMDGGSRRMLHLRALCAARAKAETMHAAQTTAPTAARRWMRRNVSAMSKITLSEKEWRTVALALRSSTALLHRLLPHIAAQCEVPEDEAMEAAN